MTKDQILQALLIELAEYENQTDINTARVVADQWARDTGIDLSDPNYTQAFNEARGQLSIGGAGTGTGVTGTSTGGTGIVSLTPVRSAADGDFSVLPPMPTMTDVMTPGAAMFGADELAARLPYDPQAIQQTPAYNVAGPAAITFYDRILNRPVPVVTKGVLPSGEPTTGITMGRADLQPSGEMDITAVFPSTGANIMGSGLGGTTVGLSEEQARRAGLPPGSSTGNILSTTANRFTTPTGSINARDILGTTGVFGDPFAPEPVATQTEVTQQAGPTREEIIQEIYRTSPTKDIAALRIGDYAVSVGGMTAEDIASAVNPVLTEQPSFNLQSALGGVDVLNAVTDFGYGTGPTGTQYITQQPLASPGPTGTVSLADQQAEMRRLFSPEAALGTDDYTQQEKACRALDYASRQGMTLADAAASYDLSEDQARQAAQELGINLSTFGFNMGGEASKGPSAVDRNLMNRAGIMGAVNDDMSKALLSNINMVMGRS